MVEMELAAASMSEGSSITRPQTSPNERVVTLFLEGEIGERALTEVFEMVQAASVRNVNQVVLDFEDVSHVDYRCIKQLLARAHAFRREGGDIKLSCLSPYVHAIFRSVGAHDAFQYFASPQHAQAAFEKSA
jgi:anti-anti-sigma factor